MATKAELKDQFATGQQITQAKMGSLIDSYRDDLRLATTEDLAAMDISDPAATNVYYGGASEGLSTTSMKTFLGAGLIYTDGRVLYVQEGGKVLPITNTDEGWEAVRQAIPQVTASTPDGAVLTYVKSSAEGVIGTLEWKAPTA